MILDILIQLANAKVDDALTRPADRGKMIRQLRAEADANAEANRCRVVARYWPSAANR
jgi:hypothetical protein